MLMDPKKLSQLIREKKKQMLTEDPQVVQSEPMPLNANDVEDNKQVARIEVTLKTPDKSDADLKNAEMSDSDAETIGLTSDEKGRMDRLRKYFDTQDVW